ncbi:MAG: glycosyl transferase [Planctomycetes bacterium]|nr:glycosyl transferase [Planctomycetota bacterium]
MQFGHFDDKSREYVITDPKTPVKWINYVGTLNFGGIVDHTGGSIICRKDPALNRISKYIPQLPASDFRGETTYIKTRREGKESLHSAFYTPCMKAYDRYECRVGLSYQTIINECEGILSEVKIIVPVGSNVEVRYAKYTNTGSTAVDLEVVPVVEFTHFDALKQFTNADWVPQTMQCKVENVAGLTAVKQAAFMKWDDEVNFFTTNMKVDSYETDRQVFLGDNGYGTWAAPGALKNESLSNSVALRGDNMAALLIKSGTLEPGESVTMISMLGQDHPSKVNQWIETYSKEENILAAIEKQDSFWNDYLNIYQCETPSDAMNSMLNVHNPRQCYTTLNWSRYLSLYQLGLGSDRGIGFRDSSQDVMGAISSAPSEAKKLMSDLLSVQNPNGSAMHQYFPLNMEANEGDSREKGNKRTYGDDHLWIVLAVCNYLKETGDYDFLMQNITFYDKNLPLAEREKASVLEHLLRALAYTKANTGKNNLPLLGFADWNDTVNLEGDAESCMIACMYGRALLEMIDLLKYLGQDEKVQEYVADHESIRERFNKAAWDGDWYIRYFTEEGEPIGSKVNEQGQIYTNAQSWSVMSGLAEDDRGVTALDSVREKLNTSFGIKLSGPGYDKFDEAKGGVTTYPPGAKENGGIFLHSNPWVVIAETMLGRGERAFEYYNQINPAARNDQLDTYEAEPYCYPQNILGDEHPGFGLARNTWLSGTSSWMYQAATQYILGIRPSHQGLLIDPCIPSEWPSYKVMRKYRGKSYDITVLNPNGVNKGVAQIKVNGQEIEGKVIPLDSEGDYLSVEVVLG